MAVTTIVNFYDVLEYMQSITELTATQETALSRIHKRVERSVRRYLNCDILQPASTYEEYLPAPTHTISTGKRHRTWTLVRRWC